MDAVAVLDTVWPNGEIAVTTYGKLPGNGCRSNTGDDDATGTRPTPSSSTIAIPPPAGKSRRTPSIPSARGKLTAPFVRGIDPMWSHAPPSFTKTSAVAPPPSPFVNTEVARTGDG